MMAVGLAYSTRYSGDAQELWSGQKLAFPIY